MKTLLNRPAPAGMNYAVEGAPKVQGPWLPVQDVATPGMNQMTAPLNDLTKSTFAPANLRTPSHVLRCLPLLAIWFSVTVLALAQPTSTLQFAASTYTVAESAGTVMLTVQRVNDTNTPVSVDYATADGTATHGLKYTAVSGTLAFGVGETNQTIVVLILNNGFVEGTKDLPGHPEQPHQRRPGHAHDRPRIDHR